MGIISEVYFLCIELRTILNYFSFKDKELNFREKFA